jgi:type II secretory pathway pseudopilin PulG
MKHKKMRNAFSMITAIFVIVIMASIASFVLNLAGKVTKETTAQYQNEQAILYAKSYTEFAVMAATSRDCIDTITAFIGASQQKVYEGEGYEIEVNVQYIGNNLDPANAISACKIIGNSINTPNSQGGIALIDTYIRYRDSDMVDAFLNDGESVDKNNLPWTTYHRRTLQRL